MVWPERPRLASSAAMLAANSRLRRSRAADPPADMLRVPGARSHEPLAGGLSGSARNGSQKPFGGVGEVGGANGAQEVRLRLRRRRRQPKRARPLPPRSPRPNSPEDGGLDASSHPKKPFRRAGEGSGTIWAREGRFRRRRRRRQPNWTRASPPRCSRRKSPENEGSPAPNLPKNPFGGAGEGSEGNGAGARRFSRRWRWRWPKCTRPFVPRSPRRRAARKGEGWRLRRPKPLPKCLWRR